MKQPVTYRKVRRDYLNSIDYMRKKMWRHMLVLGAIALGVILYAVFCTVHMKIQDATATRAYVHNYTQQIANMVEIDVNDTAITISSLSRAIKDNEEQGDLPVFLNQKCAVYDLDFMAVCDGDDNVEATAGNFLLSKKQMKQIREEKSFQEALNEKACAVGVLDGYVLFAVDLYEDGVKTGTFWAGNKEEKLRNIFVTKTFQKEKSGSFILNGKGDILLASSEINTYKNFSEFLKYGTILEENEKEIYKNAMEGKDRIFAFKSRLGKRFFFTCIGTDVNDWITVTVMPADLFTGFSDSYVTKMLACILAVFIIFFAFFVLLFRSYVENGEKLEKLAFCDEVTGGINRTEFRIKYQELCRKQKADQFTLVLIDCEDFKMINKSLGDKNGDRMLRYFYSIIDQSLNKEQDEFVSRTEMDHYFVLLREKHPNIVRERVEHMVKKINMFQGMDIAHFEISFWLGACPIDDNHSDLTLLQDRVRAVLQSQTNKDTGKLIYYNKILSDKMQRERELEHLFEESLKKEEFQIYFQPKINLSKKKITGAEVLVRWIIPEEGIVSPGEFIPLLEKNGKIRILDRYVFEKTCIWLKKWCDQGKAVFPVSVNLSRAHFVDENFLEDFVKISQQYQIDRGLIEFEITETVLLDASQIKNVRESLQKIHQYGFQCSIDDFGVGYSSLSLLQEFDIDTLKLDRSFFQDIHNSKARGVVECIVDIAKKLDMKTVVEGIETLQQVQYLKEMHCDTVQGFFFSRPLSIEDFEKWISQFQISNYISNEQAELVVCDENQNSIRDEGLNREKRLKYLDCMPVACCCVQILFNEKGEPDDFYFIYANRAQEMLNNMKPGSLVGKRFSDIFENADSEWSRCYYKTAYEGKSQIIRRYSREIEKYLLVHTFQLEQGSCGCVLLDVSVHERRVLGYMQNIQDIMSQQERLRKQAQVDSLTGIMNVGTGRMLIEDKLEQQEEGVCNAFFVMDIDDFKQINDTQGHMMGDEILKAFAEALKKTFRSEDVIYRLGGDEFAAFAFDIHRPEISIENIMQRFIKNISQARETFPLLYSSVGIFVSNKKHHFEDYYREADLALYETKNDGKNKYTVRKDFSDM